MISKSVFHMMAEQRALPVMPALWRQHSYKYTAEAMMDRSVFCVPRSLPRSALLHALQQYQDPEAILVDTLHTGIYQGFSHPTFHIPQSTLIDTFNYNFSPIPHSMYVYVCIRRVGVVRRSILEAMCADDALWDPESQARRIKELNTPKRVRRSLSLSLSLSLCLSVFSSYDHMYTYIN